MFGSATGVRPPTSRRAASLPGPRNGGAAGVCTRARGACFLPPRNPPNRRSRRPLAQRPPEGLRRHPTSSGRPLRRGRRLLCRRRRFSSKSRRYESPSRSLAPPTACLPQSPVSTRCRNGEHTLIVTGPSRRSLRRGEDPDAASSASVAICHASPASSSSLPRALPPLPSNSIALHPRTVPPSRLPSEVGQTVAS